MKRIKKYLLGLLFAVFCVNPCNAMFVLRALDSVAFRRGVTLFGAVYTVHKIRSRRRNRVTPQEVDKSAYIERAAWLESLTDLSAGPLLERLNIDTSLVGNLILLDQERGQYVDLGPLSFFKGESLAKELLSEEYVWMTGDDPDTGTTTVVIIKTCHCTDRKQMFYDSVCSRTDRWRGQERSLDDAKPAPEDTSFEKKQDDEEPVLEDASFEGKEEAL